jgi:hypothetical protein
LASVLTTKGFRMTAASSAVEAAEVADGATDWARAVPTRNDRVRAREGVFIFERLSGVD